MPKAILQTGPGGLDKLSWQEVPMPEPKTGEVQIEHKAIGLNFIDIYYRTGLYKLPNYPAVLGMEASGVITKIGANVQGYAVGDRVAYGIGPLGAYAQFRTIAADKIVKLPNELSFELAAAGLLKGLTAYFLVRQTFIVSKGHTVLVHAAAGGVGLLLCQLAKLLGATVIGSVGSEEKAVLAKNHGCDHVILYKKEDVAARVKELTNGQGVNAVYDSVGKATYEISLNSLMRLGIFISYGNASGPLPAIDPLDLMRRGSLFFTRPSLVHYMDDPAFYSRASGEVFELINKGLLKINVGQTYYLSDAASAQRDLEAGKTQGSTLLLPN